MADDAARRTSPASEPDLAASAPTFGHDEPRAPIERELSRGLRFLHIWTSRTREDAWNAVMGLHSVVDLLIAKGIITADELDRQSELTAPRVQEAYAADPQAPAIGTVEDKYAVESPEIDCAARLHLCRARCCTLRVPLSVQDLDEGLVRWDYGSPYYLARRPDGYCVHCHAETRACGVYAQRPAPCRSFDCRFDTRIWLDFEARIPADYAAIDAEKRAARAALQVATPAPRPPSNG
jgi:hypothetical protein